MLLFTFTMYYSTNGLPVDQNTAITFREKLYGRLTVSESSFPSKQFDVHFKEVRTDINSQTGGNTAVLVISNG